MDARGDEGLEGRRAFLRMCGRTGLLAALAGLGAFLFRRRRGCRSETACAGCPASSACGDSAAPVSRRVTVSSTVWQIDPAKCVQCGRCATHCVLNPSAVKCVHSHGLCGYCELCFGYFRADADELTTGAENQACPTGALQRRYVEDPYHEYTIDEAKCIACGICVKGCNTFGNGSLFLQVRHDLCLNCNECSIARVCPAQAFKRVPAQEPYLLKGEGSA